MSQESYRLFINICDLYLVLLQVMLFLVVWDIFFRPERGKKEGECGNGSRYSLWQLLWGKSL